MNPTEYRAPKEYRELISRPKIVEDLGNGKSRVTSFTISNSQNMKAYIKYKKNSNQVAWVCRKTVEVVETASLVADGR